MLNAKITSYTSSLTEHDNHHEEPSLYQSSSNNLELFLKQHYDSESSKFNEIYSVIEKVETVANSTELFRKPSADSSDSYSRSSFEKNYLDVPRYLDSPRLPRKVSFAVSAGPKTPRMKLPIIKEEPFHKESPKINLEIKKRRFSCPQFHGVDHPEVFGGFVMIDPITNQNEVVELDSEEVGKLMNLDTTLFPKNIIQYVTSLKGDDPKAIMENIVDFIQQEKNNDMIYFMKRKPSEMNCSMSLGKEDIAILKSLLKELLEKLNEEPISVQQKYKETISHIQHRYISLKETKNPNPAPLNHKIEEEEFKKLNQYISSLQKEHYLISSKDILKKTNHFLSRILHKISLTYGQETFSFMKGISIDYITLPNLLEKMLESPKVCFCRKFLTYTYDFYMTPLNLLLFLVYKYFVPEPLNISPLELEHFKTKFVIPRKAKILKLIKFWVEERIQDFTIIPHLIFLLGAFLRKVNSDKMEDTKIEEAIESLTSVYDNLLLPIPKKAKKHPSTISMMEEAGDISQDDIFLKQKRLSEKKTSAFTNPSFYFHFGQAEQIEEEENNGKDEEQNQEERNSPIESTPQKARRSKLYLIFTACEPSFPEETPQYHEIIKKPAEELARQLTLIDSKVFGKVNIREMIVKRWSKKDKSHCPTYNQYVSRFNYFSYWLQYIILSQKDFKERVSIAKKFLDVAILCLRHFSNYCTAHYIFSAIVSLQNFGVIHLEGPCKEKYKALSKVFASPENYVAVYEKVFRGLTKAAVPSLTIFLRIFLKLQDGVVFKVKLDGGDLEYLKFPTLVQIQDYCNEMRRFQRDGFEEIIDKDERLYKYLKKEFIKEVPMSLDDPQEVMKKLTSMVNEIKNKGIKNIFQFKTKTDKG